MSIDLVAACLWLPLDPIRKLVLLSLCENASQNGRCYASEKYAAVRVGLSERRVRDHFHALTMHGWCRIVQRGSKRTVTSWQLDADRIMREGDAAKIAFRDQHPSQQDETSGKEATPDVKSRTPDVGDNRPDVGDNPLSSTSTNGLLEPSVKPSVRTNGHAQSTIPDREKHLTPPSNRLSVSPPAGPIGRALELLGKGRRGHDRIMGGMRELIGQYGKERVLTALNAIAPEFASVDGPIPYLAACLRRRYPDLADPEKARKIAEVQAAYEAHPIVPAPWEDGQ